MRRKSVRKILIIAGLILLVYIFIFGKYGLVKIITMRIGIANTERNIKVYSGIRDALTADKYRLKFDTLCIEEVIRSYGMVRKGEVCTVIIE